jgi:hypothetical protein
MKKMVVCNYQNNVQKEENQIVMLIYMIVFGMKVKVYVLKELV